MVVANINLRLHYTITAFPPIQNGPLQKVYKNSTLFIKIDLAEAFREHVKTKRQTCIFSLTVC